MTLTTLVSGGYGGQREAAIAAALDPALPTALILEGLPDGASKLDGITDRDTIQIARIAPGCLCCTGNLTMRVTLNRMLRHHPARLYISLATTAHLEQIRHFLQQEPYDKLIGLTDGIQL